MAYMTSLMPDSALKLGSKVYLKNCQKSFTPCEIVIMGNVIDTMLNDLATLRFINGLPHIMDQTT